MATDFDPALRALLDTIDSTQSADELRLLMRPYLYGGQGPEAMMSQWALRDDAAATQPDRQNAAEASSHSPRKFFSKLWRKIRKILK